MQASGSGRGFWDLLPAEDRRLLGALGRGKEYPPGTTMCVEGDPATHVFILLDGWVKVLSVTEDGRESTVALRGAGDIVGESAGETSGQRNATIQALAVVHALIVGYDRFSSFLDARPGGGHAYRRMMTYRWNDAETALRMRAVTSGAQRLAGLLLGLAERLDRQAGGPIEIVLPLSQEELADLAGTSRATVTRALDSWRRRGLIRTGQRRITLIDVPGLRKAAGPAAPLRDRTALRGKELSVTAADAAPAESGMLRSALELTARGWHVFPCVPGGKRPALRENWQQLATADTERVRAWWTRSRSPYNIGIACGPSGLVVVDLDVSRIAAAGGPAGERMTGHGAEALAALCREHGEPYPADTYAVATPSGGHHLYFTATGSRVRNSARRLGALIDVRADGGYVVAAGSRMGRRAYVVMEETVPAPLPGWIAALLQDRPPPEVPQPLPPPGSQQGTAYAMAALRDETRRVAAAQQGTRNDTLNRAAFSLGQLVAADLLPPLAVITALASAAKHAGLPGDEALRTIRSGMTAGARKPRA